MLRKHTNQTPLCSVGNKDKTGWLSLTHFLSQAANTMVCNVANMGKDDSFNPKHYTETSIKGAGSTASIFLWR